MPNRRTKKKSAHDEEDYVPTVEEELSYKGKDWDKKKKNEAMEVEGAAKKRKRSKGLKEAMCVDADAMEVDVGDDDLDGNTNSKEEDSADGNTMDHDGADRNTIGGKAVEEDGNTSGIVAEEDEEGNGSDRCLERSIMEEVEDGETLNEPCNITKFFGMIEALDALVSKRVWLALPAHHRFDLLEKLDLGREEFGEEWKRMDEDDKNVILSELPRNSPGD
eukprot:841427_1